MSWPGDRGGLGGLKESTGISRRCSMSAVGGLKRLAALAALAAFEITRSFGGL
jgi:hypothetical protein